MMVRFYYAPVKSGEDENGVPVYADKVFVTINVDSTNTVERPARDSDFERFPDQYEYFKKSTAAYEPIEGQVPLEMWPMCTPADVANLKVRDIRTVEQLAKVGPDMLKRMPPAVAALVTSAKNYLSMAGSVNKASERADAIISENANLKEEVGILRAEVAALRKDKAQAA
jgi:hypothetical protein